jgi:hypothetical protein
MSSFSSGLSSKSALIWVLIEGNRERIALWRTFCLCLLKAILPFFRASGGVENCCYEDLAFFFLVENCVRETSEDYFSIARMNHLETCGCSLNSLKARIDSRQKLHPQSTFFAFIPIRGIIYVLGGSGQNYDLHDSVTCNKDSYSYSISIMKKIDSILG